MRGLSDAQNTYLAGDALLVITLIDINLFGQSNLHFTDAPFDVDYDGRTYFAQGNFMSVSESQETADIQTTNINLVISALDGDMVTKLARSEQINEQVIVYKAFFDPTNYNLIGDSSGDNALIVFKGNIAGYQIKDSADTATITLEITSQFNNFNRTSGRRSNLGSFQREFPTDYFMQYSHETLADIRWGKD